MATVRKSSYDEIVVDGSIPDVPGFSSSKWFGDRGGFWCRMTRTWVFKPGVASLEIVHEYNKAAAPFASDAWNLRLNPNQTRSVVSRQLKIDENRAVSSAAIWKRNKERKALLKKLNLL
jgi:hypothetical protein